MASQTAIDRVDIGPGTLPVSGPGQLPVDFHSRLFDEPGTNTRGKSVRVSLDRANVCITPDSVGASGSVIAPLNSYAGVMVQIAPSDQPGSVAARLILKHSDPQLSVLLIETDRPEALATAWPSWASALELPMLVCDTGGSVKPIEAYSARPSGTPHPRRKLALLTGRRPRFLVRRTNGPRQDEPTIHTGEREIIARS
ncbi:DUF6101 family protein [Roseibium sp.]|uniref:DUF6101 family protein n=1 Tax=Roseibium sp. TaxID=1936156 RepID=UPI003A96CCCE